MEKNRKVMVVILCNIDEIVSTPNRPHPMTSYFQGGLSTTKIHVPPSRMQTERSCQYNYLALER